MITRQRRRSRTTFERVDNGHQNRAAQVVLKPLFVTALPEATDWATAAVSSGAGNQPRSWTYDDLDLWPQYKLSRYVPVLLPAESEPVYITRSILRPQVYLAPGGAKEPGYVISFVQPGPNYKQPCSKTFPSVPGSPEHDCSKKFPSAQQGEMAPLGPLGCATSLQPALDLLAKVRADNDAAHQAHRC